MTPARDSGEGRERRPARQCVILAGGLGTRLGDRTKTTPKPLLDVGGAPFLETLFAEGRRRGFDEFLLLAGHLSEKVAAFVAEREIERRFACRVALSVEPTPLGTGGALVHALPRLQERFLLLNGDTWFDFNWLDLAARAPRDEAGAALALRRIAGPDRYETVETAGSLVRAIRPRGERAGAAWINGGVYAVSRRALEGFAAPSSLERDILPELLARGELRAYRYSGFFIDIGIPETLAAAADLVPPRRRRPAVFLHSAALIAVDGRKDHEPGRIAWRPRARDAVKLLNDSGYSVFVVASSGADSEGFGDDEAVRRLHARMAEELAARGASVDDWRSGPLAEGPARPAGRARGESRSPAILDLMANWPVEREGSLFVGGEERSLEAARAAGISACPFEGGDLVAFLRANIGPTEAKASGRSASSARKPRLRSRSRSSRLDNLT